MGLEVKGDRSERRCIGGVEEAVEFITHRPHENFVIYNATQVVIDEIRRRVRNTIRQG